MEQQYDTPSAEEVYEGDDGMVHVVPVEVMGTVRTDEMPTNTVWRHVLLPTGGNAQKVLNEDPRRKMSVIWTIVLGGGCEGVMVGTREDVDGNTGAVMLVGTGALRYETSTKNELWAKGIVMNDTTGTFTGFGPSTDDAIMSFAVDQWSD
jgi:hypothetical protein